MTDGETPPPSQFVADDLAQLFAEVSDFNRNVIHATLSGAAAKVAQEAAEFAAEPSLEEARDILIALLGWLYLDGRDPDELIDAALVKMHINRHLRTWHKMPDGTYQHD